MPVKDIVSLKPYGEGVGEIPGCRQIQQRDVGEAETAQILTVGVRNDA